MGGLDSLKPSNVLYLVFVFFLSIFQMFLYVSYALKYDGSEENMFHLDRVCLLVGFDFSRLQKDAFKEIFVKPVFLKSVHMLLLSCVAAYCKLKIENFTKSVCPSKKYSCFGGNYRRNFQTFYENYVLVQTYILYILSGCGLHTCYYMLGDRLDTNMMFNSWMFYTLSFDLYTLLYLPARWLLISRQNYLNILAS